MWCPYCGTKTKSNDPLLSPCPSVIQEVGNVVMTESKERANYVVHELSIEMKHKFQESQGEKMKR